MTYNNLEKEIKKAYKLFLESDTNILLDDENVKIIKILNIRDFIKYSEYTKWTLMYNYEIDYTMFVIINKKNEKEKYIIYIGDDSKFKAAIDSDAINNISLDEMNIILKKFKISTILK